MFGLHVKHFAYWLLYCLINNLIIISFWEEWSLIIWYLSVKFHKFQNFKLFWDLEWVQRKKLLLSEDEKYYLIVILINIINELVVIDHCGMMALYASQIQRQ